MLRARSACRVYQDGQALENIFAPSDVPKCGVQVAARDMLRGVGSSAGNSLNVTDRVNNVNCMKNSMVNNMNDTIASNETNNSIEQSIKTSENNSNVEEGEGRYTSESQAWFVVKDEDTLPIDIMENHEDQIAISSSEPQFVNGSESSGSQVLVLHDSGDGRALLCSMLGTLYH